MPSCCTVDDELLRRKRELRLRIGRARRRIDHRLGTVEHSGWALLSWRTYAVRYPGWALCAALGAGMTASAAFRPAKISRWLGMRLVNRGLGAMQEKVWSELRRIWKDSCVEK